MATQLFKGNETIWIQPQDIQNHLDVGWLLEDPTAPKRLPAGIEIINQKEPEEVETEEAPTIHEPIKRGRKKKSN